MKTLKIFSVIILSLLFISCSSEPSKGVDLEDVSNADTNKIKECTISFENQNENMENMGIADAGLFDTKQFSIQDIKDDNILLVKISPDNKEMMVYDDSLTEYNIPDGKYRDIYSFDADTKCIKASYCKDKIIMSLVAKAKTDYNKMKLVMLDGKDLNLIAECDSSFEIADYINYEVQGKYIVYNIIEDGKTVLCIYDMENDNTVKHKVKNPISDNQFKISDDKIITFEDMGSSASFGVYDFAGNEIQRFPFESKYRLFDYNIMKDGIIVSAQTAEEQEKMAQALDILVYEFESGCIYHADINGMCSFCSDGVNNTAIWDDKFYKVSKKDSSIYFECINENIEISSWPVKIIFGEDEYYIAGHFKNENYDTFKDVLKVRL